MRLLTHFPVDRGRTAPRRQTRGRVLIEVLVALVLLAVGASASVALVRADLAVGDRIDFVASSRAVTRETAELLHVSPCAASVGSAQLGRTEVVWSPASAGAFVALAIVASGRTHPSGLAAPRPLHARLGGWCQ